MKIFTEYTDIRPSYDMRDISPLGEMLLFDIETTGLKKETTQIYLIGCGSFDEDGRYVVKQWLTESASDEREVLDAFADFARRYKTLVHFNGDGFDIPYTSYKAWYYGMDLDFSGFKSVDIYKRIKPYKKFLGLERMNQTSIEAFLKVEREDKMNGGLLIPYYYEYEKTGDEECEKLLLLHNSDDVKGMIQLAGVLAYADIFEGKYSFTNVSYTQDAVIMEYELKAPVPRSVTADYPHITVCADKSLLQITADIYSGNALIPVKNVQDYYYLPLEDRIIHKDVAAFVNKKYRKKATAKNCFLKKEGRFVAAPFLKASTDRLDMSDISGNLMIPDEKGKLRPCIELDELLSSDEHFMEKLAEGILTAL